MGWVCVTQVTVAHCFRHCGFTGDIAEESDQTQQTEPEVQERTNIFLQFQELFQLPTEVTLESLTRQDDQCPSSEILTEEEIVAITQGVADEEEEPVETESTPVNNTVPAPSDALQMLDKLERLVYSSSHTEDEEYPIRVLREGIQKRALKPAKQRTLRQLFFF